MHVCMCVCVFAHTPISCCIGPCLPTPHGVAVPLESFPARRKVKCHKKKILHVKVHTLVDSLPRLIHPVAQHWDLWTPGEAARS